MRDWKITDPQLLEMMKIALGQVLDERRDLFREIVDEVLEDIALVRAIEEGADSPFVGRNEVFDIINADQ